MYISDPSKILDFFGQHGMVQTSNIKDFAAFFFASKWSLKQENQGFMGVSLYSLFALSYCLCSIEEDAKKQATQKFCRSEYLIFDPRENIVSLNPPKTGYSPSHVRSIPASTHRNHQHLTKIVKLQKVIKHPMQVLCWFLSRKIHSQWGPGVVLAVSFLMLGFFVLGTRWWSLPEMGANVSGTRWDITGFEGINIMYTDRGPYIILYPNLWTLIVKRCHMR